MIAPETTVGAVHLTVSDLARSRGYYRDTIGLEEVGDGVFGVDGTELLHLVEEPGARPATGYSGQSPLSTQYSAPVMLTPSSVKAASVLTRAPPRSAAAPINGAIRAPTLIPM